MAFNGVFSVCYYSIYLCYALTLYIYRYKKKVKKVCKIFGILEIITTFASGNGYIV